MGYINTKAPSSPIVDPDVQPSPSSSDKSPDIQHLSPALVKNPEVEATSSCLQYRYFVFMIMLMLNFQESISRFGLPMAMVGGMTKQNCSDPLDNGTYCWTEGEKANILGAFFYTYTLQIFPIMIARKIGFPIMVKIFMIVSALMTGGVPWFAKISPWCIIVTQAVRGLFVPIMIAYNYELMRTWPVKNSECVFYLAASGASMMMGFFIGGFISGLISINFGWESYFYLCGANFFIMFIAYQIFIPINPEHCKFMPQSEKDLYRQKEDLAISEESKAPYLELFQRSYLWAFSAYIIGLNMVFITLLVNMPIFLKEIIKMETTDISIVYLMAGLFIMFGTLASTQILVRIVDRMSISWLRRRQFTAFGPLSLLMLLLIILPSIESPAAVSILTVLMISCFSNMFAGNLFTISYEIDPLNSSTMISIWNSFAQVYTKAIMCTCPYHYI